MWVKLYVARPRFGVVPPMPSLLLAQQPPVALNSRVPYSSAGGGGSNFVVRSKDSAMHVVVHRGLHLASRIR